MMRTKLILVCLPALLLSAASSAPAFAWGCTAVASDGAYGYSANWPDEQDAEIRALKEFDKRTTTNDCQEESCDPNG